MVAVEVTISRARCIASKCCVNLAPGVFALDDTQVSSVVDSSAAPDDTIVEAAETPMMEFLRSLGISKMVPGTLSV